MVGPKPADPKQDAKRKWKGHGFNLIWRPNFDRSEGSEFGQKEFFLQLNLTDEELDFTEITGTGIANRSLFEDTITLGGIAYTQAIKDTSTSRGSILSPGFGPMCHKQPIRKATNNCPHGINSPRNDSSICRALQHIWWRRRQHSIRRVSRRSLLATQTTARPPLFLNPYEEDFSKDNPSRTEKKRLPALTCRSSRKSESLFVGRPRQSNRS